MEKESMRLASIFQEGAVLQRDCPLPVWGWAPPSRRVRVTLGGHAANGWVSEHGDFKVVLPPLPVGGPHILRVELPESPDQPALAIADIQVGEVWLASGQSNMEWTLEQCGEAGRAAAGAAADPLLRIFTVERRAELTPQRDVKGEWHRATAYAAPGFSAVAYHFARRLRAELDVPVGVIVSSWGGTPVESWMPRRAHVSSPLLREKFRQYEKRAYSDERWKSGIAGGGVAFPVDPGISERAADGAPKWAAKDLEDADWPVMHLPDTWQRCGHGFSGIFWFRKKIVIPASWVGRECVLELGAVDKQDITYVNGVEVGRTGRNLEDAHWNKARVYRVPSDLVAGREVVIAVRVYSFVYDGGIIGPAERMRLTCTEAGDAILPLHGEWRYRIEHDFGHVRTESDPGHLAQKSPCILYDNMIAPLTSYALRGALWYQGESNAAHAVDYPSHLGSMISAWREDWQLGEFPFLIVQLPGYGMAAEYGASSHWARMRQGQLDLLREIPGLGLAVIPDCGDADDIHPTNKEPVGHRLAQWALSETYGKPVVKCGPLPRKATLHTKGRVRVSFDCADAGLATGDGLPVGGAFLLDGDEQAYPAVVEIDGPALWASAVDCPRPVAICYAWADFPLRANLTNGEGLPASPFRCAVMPEK